MRISDWSSYVCSSDLEDIEVGAVQRFGSKLVTREEVIDFAGKYDPQPFHLDDAAAAGTYFGRLSASGWHTGSMAMRMIVDDMKVHKQAGLGSPGIDELRWLKRSEEHTSELQSLMRISYAVFCLKKKKNN